MIVIPSLIPTISIIQDSFQYHWLNRPPFLFQTFQNVFVKSDSESRSLLLISQNPTYLQQNVFALQRIQLLLGLLLK